jgi:translation elongation factor P/translation initiation factor 5A
MNLETFETEAVDKATIGSSGNFLLESMNVQVRLISLPLEQLHCAQLPSEA